MENAVITGAWLPETDVLFKLVLAVLVGGIFGLDRELRHRSAGLRTHMLTSLAAAVFTLLTFEIFRQVHAMENTANADPLRLIEAITLGVSFLAAGAIIQRSGEVHGLTTGATIWLAGALGAGAGAGLYSLVFAGTAIGVAVTIIIRFVERYLLDTK